jgi:hypothetical protein
LDTILCLNPTVFFSIFLLHFKGFVGMATHPQDPDLMGFSAEKGSKARHDGDLGDLGGTLPAFDRCRWKVLSLCADKHSRTSGPGMDERKSSNGDEKGVQA